jgi:hypothetical protein
VQQHWPVIAGVAELLGCHTSFWDVTDKVSRFTVSYLAIFYLKFKVIQFSGL